uniref:Uncharacterized protein n=1 Tax=Romanomermis culicivorax TaxID=13658 RepID=A0A915JZF2_ROMCU
MLTAHNCVHKCILINGAILMDKPFSTLEPDRHHLLERDFPGKILKHFFTQNTVISENIQITVSLSGLSDIVDGKHARDTGNSSAVGEILDHGVDGWRMLAPIICCFFSLYGRNEMSLSVVHMAHIVLASQFTSIAIIWQQYLTKTICYDWGSDILQYIYWFYLLSSSNLYSSLIYTSEGTFHIDNENMGYVTYSSIPYGKLGYLYHWFFEQILTLNLHERSQHDL